MSEQSLEFNWMPEISTTRAVAEDTHKSPALYRSGSCAIYSAQTAYRGNLTERVTQKETSPAYTNGAALVEDMEKETDVLVRTRQEVIDRLAELNQELESMVSSTLEDTSIQEPLVDPNVNAQDTRKVWEQEFSLYPKAKRDEVCSRSYVQVGKLLHR